MDAGAWASYGRASMRWGWGGENLYYYGMNLDTANHQRAALVPQGSRSNGGSCDKHHFPCPVGGDTVYLLQLFSPHGSIELMDDVLRYSELSKTSGAIKHRHGNVFNSCVKVIIEKQRTLPKACEHTTPYNMTGSRLQN